MRYVPSPSHEDALLNKLGSSHVPFADVTQVSEDMDPLRR